ncbi:aminoglycoside adenylyltransferase domain-containing protein [Spirosoma sp. KNUC1025]|uniref:aminoglycoside adenylyltransferase domain-containing protein n=1 Tax=Spirosoma sp. KNUC1025 TaxID=2894082 RepID=UPI00386592A1|nr:DUF4111 domain-containing protein [Spirosoma sp. KNUC1025]
MDQPFFIPQSASKRISELESGLNRIGQNWVEGIYLTGSIPLGDFYPAKSDIDFLILCKEFPENAVIAELDKLHNALEKRSGSPKLNGTYITRENLQAGHLPTGQVLNYHEGRLTEGLFGMGAIALYELKTIAYTVMGVPSGNLPVDIELQQVKDFMHDNINSYWQKWINKHSSCTGRRWLMVLIPVLTEWAVLGVARQFYTLQTGEIASKMKAGQYCLEYVPAKYRDIIHQAIQIRKGEPARFYPTVKKMYSIVPSMKRVTLTIDFVNYLIERFNQVYSVQTKLRTVHAFRGESNFL